MLDLLLIDCKNEIRNHVKLYETVSVIVVYSLTQNAKRFRNKYKMQYNINTCQIHRFDLRKRI